MSSPSLVRLSNLSRYSSVSIPAGSFYVASTLAQRSKGLSGLDSLDKDGMIFVYSEDNSSPFHMQGMQFDLDIAFADLDGNILKSGTYPKGYKGKISSSKSYRFVVEIPTGTGNVQEIAKQFSADTRKKLAKTGSAMPDGSYPIENVQDLKNAIQAFGRSKNPDATKAHIIKRARQLGATELLPEGWS